MWEEALGRERGERERERGLKHIHDMYTGCHIIRTSIRERENQRQRE